MTKPSFTVYEERIIRVLTRSKRGLVINQVANYGKISWMTARKHLNNLSVRGVVKKHTEDGKQYWEFKSATHKGKNE